MPRASSAPAPRSAPPAELDELTLRRAAQREAAAARALVERYRRPVWDLCWRILAPSGLGQRVEDVAQEVFVRVFGALPGFDPRGPARLSTWILTIASRAALNAVRDARPELEPTADADLQVSALAPAPDEELARRELGELLAAAMATLPPSWRAMVVLSDVYELTYEEIAAATGVALGTVRSRLSRARAAVRQCLAASGVQP